MHLFNIVINKLVKNGMPRRSYIIPGALCLSNFVYLGRQIELLIRKVAANAMIA